MSFRVLDQNPQYFTLIGSELSPVAGGSIRFYLSGTTTPANTYSDTACTIPNTNPVLLDAYGRTVTEVWGNTSYTAVLSDANGAVLWTRDNVTTPSGFPDQTAKNGQALFTDGMNPYWGAIAQVPGIGGITDGWILTKSGSGYAWTAPPSASSSTITNAVLVNVREKVQVLAATATLTVDIRLGSVIKLTQDTNCVITIIGQPAAGEAMPFTIWRVKDATGTTRTLTLATVKWPAGVSVPVTQASGAIDVISCLAANGEILLGSYNTAMA